MDDDDSPKEETSGDTSMVKPKYPQGFDNLQLSLQALTGVANFQTMRVTWLHDKKMVHILLDSVSAHNFLDLKIAKSMECKLEAISLLAVTRGGGHQLEAVSICRAFTWQLQQAQFTVDVIVFPLVCCDLILGIQWLKFLDPILRDLNKLQMKFINNKSFAQRC